MSGDSKQSSEPDMTFPPGPCPICWYDEWEEEFDYSDEGEIHVLRCQRCGWPPTYPETVDAYRKKVLISPYLKDLEAMVAERDERIRELEERLESNRETNEEA